jgi:large subunit ribosomal protein L10
MEGEEIAGKPTYQIVFFADQAFEKNKTKMTAKAGDVAPNDIIVPAGNTGLPPGPAISELHDVGIRTKIDVGSVWIVNDATVVKKR